MLHLIVTWPQKHISNLVHSANSELCCIIFIHYPSSSVHRWHKNPCFCLCKNALTGAVKHAGFYFFMWKCLCAILLYITFHLFIQSPFRLSQYLLNNKITLLTLSWEFPNLIRSLILLLSTGCLSINEYSTNMLLYATAASTWLNSRQFTNQPTSLLLILPFSIFPLCACTHLIRDLFLMLHCLSGTVSHARLDYQTHNFRLSCWLSLSLNVCVCVCVCMWAFLQKFVMTMFCYLLNMGYVLKFGEIAHKRVRYYY